MTAASSLFTGRDAELAIIRRELDAALPGGLRVLLVAGEPGIGKSRLLAAASLIAVQRGMALLRGGSSAAQGMPPYLPFLEALGQQIERTLPEDLQAQTEAFAPVLATLLPELAIKLDLTPGISPLPPEQSRLRLYEAIGRFLAAIAADNGLLLILDDLQWADQATLELLTYIARQQPESRILVLGAFRLDEASASLPLQSAIVELERLRVVQTCTLAPLDRPALAEIAQGIIGGPLDPDASETLAAQSEGNPFFAEELARDWRETGALQLHDGRWMLAAERPPGAPPGVRRAIRHRLGRFAPDQLELLRSAAIIGRSFDLELLAEVTGIDPEQAERALQPVVDAGIARVDDVGIYSFSHDMIRECLYDDVSALRRRRLHGFIGRVLEMAPGEVSAQRLADLAFHFSRSGDRERGTHYARQSGEQAMAIFAYDEASRAFRTALDLTAPDDPDRGDLLMAFGAASSLAGNERAAGEAFDQAQGWFRTRGPREREAEAAFRLGQSWWRQEDVAQAEAALRNAAELVGDAASPLAVEIFVDLSGVIGGSRHHHLEGIAWARKALALAEAIGDVRLQAKAGRALGNLEARENRLLAGVEAFESALEMAIASGDPMEAAECCASYVPILFWLGRLRRAEEVNHLQQRFAAQCHDSYQLRHIHIWLAILGGLQGRAESLVEFERAEAIARRIASPEPMAWLQFCRGTMALVLGDLETSVRELETSIASFRTMGPGALIWYLGTLGLAYARLGRSGEARAVGDELTGLLDALPPETTPPGEPIGYLAEIGLALDEPRYFDRSYAHLAITEARFVDMLVDRLLGEIELRRGEFAAAEKHLAAAVIFARREGFVWELAQTIEAQAKLIRATSRDESAADRLLDEADAIYRSHDNQPGQARIAALRTPNQASMLPARLSPREADVLRLLAGGMSNREIAATLFLSEKTIENHLTSIYGKLVVENRAAAAAFAVRNGLV